MHTPSTEPPVCTPHSERGPSATMCCTPQRERTRFRVKSTLLSRTMFKTIARHDLFRGLGTSMSRRRITCAIYVKGIPLPTLFIIIRQFTAKGSLSFSSFKFFHSSFPTFFSFLPSFSLLSLLPKNEDTLQPEYIKRLFNVFHEAGASFLRPSFFPAP